MNDEQTTALSVKNAEIGKALISEAERRHEEQRKEAVISEVQRLIRARDEYLDKEKFAARAADWYRAKLAALDAGEFEFSTAPGLTAAGSVIFKNSDFNRANY